MTFCSTAYKRPHSISVVLVADQSDLLFEFPVASRYRVWSNFGVVLASGSDVRTRFQKQLWYNRYLMFFRCRNTYWTCTKLLKKNAGIDPLMICNFTNLSLWENKYIRRSQTFKFNYVSLKFRSSLHTNFFFPYVIYLSSWHSFPKPNPFPNQHLLELIEKIWRD